MMVAHYNRYTAYLAFFSFLSFFHFCTRVDSESNHFPTAVESRKDSWFLLTKNQQINKKKKPHSSLLYISVQILGLAADHVYRNTQQVWFISALESIESNHFLNAIESHWKQTEATSLKHS